MARSKVHQFERESGFKLGDIIAVSSHHGFVNYERVENIAKNMNNEFTIWTEEGTGHKPEGIVKIGNLPSKVYDELLKEAQLMEDMGKDNG